jgi:hypothetical protein
VAVPVEALLLSKSFFTRNVFQSKETHSAKAAKIPPVFLANQQQTIFPFPFYWRSVNTRQHLLLWMIHRQAPKMSQS